MLLIVVNLTLELLATWVVFLFLNFAQGYLHRSHGGYGSNFGGGVGWFRLLLLFLVTPKKEGR